MFQWNPEGQMFILQRSCYKCRHFFIGFIEIVPIWECPHFQITEHSYLHTNIQISKLQEHPTISTLTAASPPASVHLH